ncbi:MAG: zinc ribbon domain-containing protein, partial [Limnoraphis robusta]
SNSWAFYQLRQFLEYKGVKSGVKVVAISPRYTSQTCHKCLHIHPEQGKSYRSGKTFKCGYCGWKGDADLNGAKMISIVGQSVSLSCNAQSSILFITRSVYRISANAPRL